MVTGSSGSRRPRRASPPRRISVLRLGHRAGRDPRLSTHVALTARALGADRMYLSPPDPALAERVGAVASRFGGSFQVEGIEDYRQLVKSFEGTIVHLTMYGEPLDRVLPRLRLAKSLLVVIGGAKVPADVYRLADRNVSVGSQPHSEVAALAILLDRLHGIPGQRGFPNARQRVVPSARGKRVEDLRGRSK